MKCKKCGYENDEDSIFCQECGTKMEENSDDKNQFEQATTKLNEKINDIVHDRIRMSENDEAKNTVVLAENEFIIREYDATRVRYLFIKEYNGKLMITNKRIIFYAGNTTGDKTVMELQINSAGPITGHLGNVYNGVVLLASVITMILGIVLCNESIYLYSLKGYGVLLIAASVILFMFRSKKGMYFRIGAINAGPGITLGRGDTISSSQYCIIGKPGPDACKMINEFGAIVLDLQQLGDIAIDKWKCKE